MDRGFYSEDNINDLYQNHLKFLIAAKTSLKFVKAELESGKRNPEHEKQYDKYFDIIECFEQPGHDLRVGEVTKRQVELYEAMEIAPPASLH